MGKYRPPSYERGEDEMVKLTVFLWEVCSYIDKGLVGGGSEV